MRQVYLAFFTATLLLVAVQQGFGGNRSIPTGPPDTFDVSVLSKEERQWLQRFYSGTFFAEGWDQITQTVLTHTDEHNWQEQSRKLEELGLKIGVEWAKDNALRKIDTEMLQKWGDALRHAARSNPRTLPQVLVGINQEVDSILP